MKKIKNLMMALAMVIPTLLFAIDYPSPPPLDPRKCMYSEWNYMWLLGGAPLFFTWCFAHRNDRC